MFTQGQPSSLSIFINKASAFVKAESVILVWGGKKKEKKRLALVCNI